MGARHRRRPRRDVWHGNGELVADHTAFADRLGELGWDFVGVELRGYGDASGWPREASLDRDARAAWSWVTTEGGYSQDRVILHGRSVGGGPAAKLASQVGPPGLVLESTFDSLAAVAGDKVPFIPGLRWLMRSPYETIRLGLTIPVFEVHGQADEIIGIEHARALSGSLTNVRYLEVPGMGHNVPILMADADAQAAWIDWLETVVPK